MSAHVLAATLLVLFVFTAQAQLDESRVHWVTSGASYPNYLFRGDLPILNDSFAYPELIEYIGNAATTEGNFTLPSSVFLYDVNLLTFITDPFDDTIEFVWFDEHPTKGQFIHWPTVGDLILGWPANFSSDIVRDLATTMPDWDTDKLSERIPQMQLYIETDQSSVSGGLPVAIYVHCDAGIDRTGEIIGAYGMQYMNLTLQDVYTIDHQIGGRAIHKYNAKKLAWYCWYLYYTFDIDRDCVGATPLL